MEKLTAEPEPEHAGEALQAAAVSAKDAADKDAADKDAAAGRSPLRLLRRQTLLCCAALLWHGTRVGQLAVCVLLCHVMYSPLLASMRGRCCTEVGGWVLTTSVSAGRWIDGCYRYCMRATPQLLRNARV